MNLRASIPFLAVVLTGSAFGQTALSDIRFWSQPGVTRIAIELSAEPVFRQERLTNPDRVFFDFQNTRARINGKLSATIAVGDPQLRQIRVGESKPGFSRVVLDLSSNAALTTEVLSNPTRLVIELRRPGAEVVKPPAPKVISTYFRVPLITAPPPALMTYSRQLYVPPPKYPPFGRAVAKPVETAVRKAEPADIPTASLTRALGLKIRRIVLDPGHGGQDQGTAGPTGLTEKEVVLDIAQRLGEMLTEALGAEVIYTRNSDKFIPLEQRTKIANDSKADLFLSIHANSSPIKSISGVETYFLSFTTSKSAMETAARENATSERGIFELRDLLQKIALKEKVDESREFASRVNAALYKSWYNPAANVRNRGVKRAPFVVLIGANMPSILAEIGFLSNARDEKELRKPEVRQKLAEALFKGISQYADSLSHFQVARRAGALDEE